MDNSEKKTSRPKWRIILAVGLALLFVVSCAGLIHWQIQVQAAERAAREAMEAAQATPSPTIPAATPTPEPTPPPDPNAAALMELDIQSLRETNPDVLGWIEVPGTELSYPLLQGEDNQYYLTHTWQKQPNSAGSIFMECTNAPDLSGYHTIIYGHRMTNDSMFGTLKYYKDPAYRDAHPSVYLVMPDGVYRYDIFAAFTAHVRGMVYRLDLPGKEEEFVQFCLENSELDSGLAPTAEDQILTLSTCVDMGQSDYRWVVQGYLAQRYQR